MEERANASAGWPPLRSGAVLLLGLALAGCRKDPPPEPDAAPPGVSLLQLTPSRLALEWQFDESGPTPFVGWKGRWLAVRIPKDAHVSAIHVTSESAMRVSIWRDGKKLREASLNGASVIPLDEPGGDYRFEALGEPARIRDFDVRGQPGVERRSVAKLPEVRYGSLEQGEHISGPWPDLVSYCEKMHGEHCTGGAFFPEEGLQTGYASHEDGDRLAIATKRGWFVLRGPKNIDRESVRQEKPEAGPAFLRFDHVERTELRFGGDSGIVDETRWRVTCRLIDDWPDCDERVQNEGARPR